MHVGGFSGAPFLAQQLWEQPSLVDELATCEAYGVPWSVLRGDRAPGEAWTRRDADLAVAYTIYRQSLCSGCGVPQHVGWDYDRSHDERHRPRWEADDPSRCYVCTAREQASKGFVDENTTVPSALRFSVKYRPPA